MQKSKSGLKQRLWFNENAILCFTPYYGHMFHGLSLVNSEGESSHKLQSSFSCSKTHKSAQTFNRKELFVLDGK